MTTFTTQKILISLVVLLLLGFFGYNLFMRSVPISSFSESGGEMGSDDVISLVEKLKSISIDQSIFSSPLFKNLKDFEVTPTPESQGRVNPFAPIGTEFGFQAVTATTSIKKQSR